MCSDRRFEKKIGDDRRLVNSFFFPRKEEARNLFHFRRRSDIFLFFCSTSLLREALDEILL